MQFKTFEARRLQDQQPGSQVRVDHNSTLSNVQQDGDGRLRVEFAFSTSYGALGLVRIEGALLMKTDKPDEALAQWNKDRNLPPEQAQEVHQAILASCMPEAVVLAKGLRLPPPIPLPQVRFQGKDASTGSAQATTEPGPDAA